MRILVLGGAGFLGSWAIRALISEQHDVTAIVRPASRLWRIDTVPEISIVVADEEDWPAEILRRKPQTIISMDWAGVAREGRDDEAMQWSNVYRQRSVIAAAIMVGTQRFVGLGSQAEYGPRFTPIDERAANRAVTAYGRAKVAAFEQLRALAEIGGLDWVWARVFSIYGPLDNPGFLLHTVAIKLLSRENARLSSGKQLWSYLYASDAAQAFALLASHPEAHGLYNVGHPVAPSLRELVETFAQNFPGSGSLSFERVTPKTPVSASLEPVTSRLNALGWSPQVVTETGLQKTANWLKGQTVRDPFIAGADLPLMRQSASHTLRPPS